MDNSLNVFIIINYFMILRQWFSSIFFKLSQLITFYSDKKHIYEILCVIKQHDQRLNQSKTSKVSQK